MRITILGLPGSGKSTLAESIARELHVPHIHLDGFWIEGGGGHNSRTTPNPEQTHAYMRAKVLEAIQSESWVSDGGYALIQPEIAKRADTMIFLDVPLRQRLLNHAKRTLRSMNGKDKLSVWSNIEFFFEMIQPELRSTKKIQDFLSAFEGKVVVLHSQREVNGYLKKGIGIKK
jgi:adenylate kinase family enzyme